MATATYTASLITRKTSSSSNAKTGYACQEYYTNTYNYVGIICFSGMALTNKVITGISITAVSQQAGYGAGHTKTVYVRKSNYQNTSASATGAGYAGDALGTFTGSFYNNTTTVALSGTLLTNLAAYFAAGNNTICIYNPSPVESSHGYSNNYLQWSSVTLTVTYTEGVSVPTVSSSSVNLGSAVTISTNRLTTSATHTLTYAFGNASGTIATNVGASVSWTPGLALAAQIPNATSGLCTVTCKTFVGGTETGSSSVTLTLNVPSSVVPSITSVSTAEATSGIASQFGGYVRTRSKLTVGISASGAQGSTISAYRTTLDNVTYTASSFTSNTLNTAGTLTMTVTVTDSRGRTATTTKSIPVLDYSPPSLTKFKAERCNADGSAAQMDGTKVRVSLAGSVSSVGSKNTVSCAVYYKLTTSTSWVQATIVSASNYAVSTANLLLSATFDALKSYDLKVRLSDYFYYVEQSVSVGTKQVLMDFYKDGNGVAFGKVAESSGKVEFGWPVVLSTPLGVDQGGTGATTAPNACAKLGAVKKSGDTMTGNLSISGYLYPSVYLLPTYNSTTNRTVFEGSYVGASSFASWQDSSGNNRRMLEVRNAAYEAGRDNALVLRDVVDGSYYTYRVFHAGMTTPVPIANGGTGANSAANARANIGANNASNLTTGTVPAARLPFKVAYGSTSISGSSSVTINYSSAGFTAVPKVLVTYSTTSSNWSGDNGAIKVHSKTTTQASIVVGGSFNTSRNVDWLAIGT